MELREAIARRRMVRSFSDEPLDRRVLDELLALALRAPSAGNTRGTSWVALAGAEETERYWRHVTTPDWRRRSRRWEGLSRAPVVALALASPDAYLARYAEPDKEVSGLGHSADAWPVPYWFGDAACSVMSLLLLATDAGLGACFLGNFRGEGALMAELGVPTGWRLYGAVLLGHADGLDHPSPSLGRQGPGLAERVRHGGW